MTPPTREADAFTPPDGTAGTTAQELFLGLRVAVTTISGAVLATASLPRKLDVHEPALPQLVAYGILVALLVTEITLLLAGKEWGRARLPALVLVLAASVLSTWTLRPEYLVTSTDWSFGTSSWLGVVLLFNRPLPHLVGFLALHELVTAIRVATLPGVTDDVLLNLIAGSVGTIGFPLACGIASTALRTIADDAEQASARAAAIRQAEAVAAGLHDARTARLAQLDSTTEPLLEGLAEGRLSPSDPAVRRACAVEAARLRRFLAETDQVDDPVTHGLRHGADVAQRQGVEVDLQQAGSWSQPDVQVRRALLDGPLAVLAQAATTARVSVIGSFGYLSVSVVADGLEWDIPPSNHPDVDYLVTPGIEEIWMEARWNDPSPSS